MTSGPSQKALDMVYSVIVKYNTIEKEVPDSTPSKRRTTVKSLRITIPAALLSLATAALAQSNAQASFDEIKSLAGSWEGKVTVVPPMPDMDKPMHVSMRVTSRGHAIVHEMQEAGTPEDPSHYEHPVTMFY